MPSSRPTWSGLLERRDHRPYPLPDRPWHMTMTWSDLLFAHWPFDPDHVRRLLPPGLTLDTHEGRAWVGVVPFRMTNVGPRGLNWLPGLSAFLELNVRTYVVEDGRPGVWFFSLDAANPLAVRGARLAFHLPYFHATMRSEERAGWTHYRSERRHRGAPEGLFQGRFRPTGEVYASQPGSLDHWLTERYCLYVRDRRGHVRRGEIHHLPWPLQPAEAELDACTVSDGWGLPLPDAPPLLHFVRRLDVVAWLLSPRPAGVAAP